MKFQFLVRHSNRFDHQHFDRPHPINRVYIDLNLKLCIYLFLIKEELPHFAKLPHIHH